MNSATGLEPDAYEEFLVLYLRLLHDYERLRWRYEHARAAIDNDLFAAECEERFKSLEF